MLGRTLHELIFIRTCIVVLQYPILPYGIALATCLASAKLGPPDPRWAVAARWVVGLICLELAYAVLIWKPYRTRLRETAKHPAPASPAARQALFDRCMATVSNPEHYLRTWFLGAEMADIHRDNVRDFLLWAFFDQRSEDGPGQDSIGEIDREVDRYIAQTEKLLGRPLEPGRGRAKCLRLTFDEIETKYRTVWWYGIMAIVDSVTHLLLVLNGFEYYAQPRENMFDVFPPRFQQLTSRHRTPGEISYWHRSHEQPESLPIVFFHGIGVGLWVYIQFLAEVSIAKIKGKGNVGVIAIEILPISFRLTKPPLGKEAFLQQLTAILDHHKFQEFVLVSHSYGSVLTTHAIRSPEMQARIPRAVLIDPVTILLHLPDVAYNFTRRQPKRANEWQLWYFASTDPGVAHCLGRYFFWRENAIWAEELTGRCAGPDHASALRGTGLDKHDIARQVTVCLSGQDLIVDSHAVARYLAEHGQTDDPTPAPGENKHGQRNVAVSDSGADHDHSAGPGIDVLWFPRKDHAQVFDSRRDRGRIVDVVRGYCKK